MGSTASWDDPPSQESIDFFLDRMHGHSKVRRVVTHSENRYDLLRTGDTKIKVFLTNTYEFTVSDYAELRSRYPDVNCVVSMSHWNHFTTEVIHVAHDDGVATFFLGELMGALNRHGDGFFDYIAPKR